MLKPKCLVCKKEITFIRSNTKKLCSVVCSGKYLSANYAGENSSAWKGGKPKCLDCGKKVSRREYIRCVICNNKLRIGKKFPEVGPAISKAKKGKEAWWKGEKHWNWVDDRFSLARRNGRGDTAASLVWARTIKKRDGRVCKMSNNDCTLKLEVHHILPVRDFPELRYNIDNGITLCSYHHPRGKSEELRLAPYLTKLVSISN